MVPIHDMPHRKESIEKMRQRQSNKTLSETHKKNIGVSLKQSEKAKEANLNRRGTRTGKDNHMFGKHLPDWQRENLCEYRYGGFWYGNVSYPEIYCELWTAELRERCRAYFGYICFECGTPQGKRKLHVHHVNYDKKTCCNGSRRLLVPLCNSCHIKSNTNRQYWTDHFTEMIDGYYGGKCFFTKEEMKAYRGR